MELRTSFRVWFSDNLKMLGCLSLLFLLVFPILLYLDRDGVEPSIGDFVGFYSHIFPVLFIFCAIFAASQILRYLMERCMCWTVDDCGIRCEGLLRTKQFEWGEIENLVYNKSFTGGEVILVKRKFKVGSKIYSITESEYREFFDVFVKQYRLRENPSM
ncbi:MAG: hypothetical protein ACSHX8_12830 [Opitutaceae bacterium]